MRTVMLMKKGAVPSGAALVVYCLLTNKTATHACLRGFINK